MHISTTMGGRRMHDWHVFGQHRVIRFCHHKQICGAAVSTCGYKWWCSRCFDALVKDAHLRPRFVGRLGPRMLRGANLRNSEKRTCFERRATYLASIMTSSWIDMPTPTVSVGSALALPPWSLSRFFAYGLRYPSSSGVHCV